MPQKRHTVDQIVAKLRKADVEICNALRRLNGCKFGVDYGEGAALAACMSY